ncbi:MAG: hypothetical protein HOF69_02850 [Campylobacteraceae bacterium]|jgi:hypothetical protein|nr:hypothetical protein [Campylobacteraceae bacterium]MBT3882185.1 hypothetical protein [Campylobacteraceae bacterium]MBT4030155.1 hypothetical protein [Campylobacteraceae bacterium]MBT4179046.1 hypothetical protein [Campylobacteraceae bacterium]MBT4572570.1 hypothetical protein [Campylobacteraceae bacterium]
MKFIFISLISIILSLSINANSISDKEFFSRVLPLEQYVIKSTVSGQIVYVNSQIEGKFANNSTIIEIDKELDRLELEQLKAKSLIINKMIKIESQNYKRISKISSKSKFEKDNQKLKVLTLESSNTDLQIKIHSLRDRIKHKTLNNTSDYIYDIAIKNGDYVNPGSILYYAHDLSSAKLEIFIPINDVKTISNQTIYLNGVKSDYKINKIYKVADTQHISSYKCEIIIDKPNNFSKLIKIEFK